MVNSEEPDSIREERRRRQGALLRDSYESESEVSESALRYLKAIFLLSIKDIYVRLSLIANTLGVSLPAVSITVRRLQDSGLVEVDSKKGVRLTSAGLALVMRRCAKRMMIDSSLFALGLPAPLRIVMAKVLELGLDEESVTRLWIYAGRPRVCPLGNPVYTFDDIRNMSFEEFARRASICCHMKELFEKRAS
ncbi:MAG: metal-dependent transcriptional regulator [Acidilobaceae archaeon]